MTRWYVYLIRRGDGALYTGISTAIARRLAQHRVGTGTGAKSLRGRGPLRLVFTRAIGDRGLALRVENRIKRLPKVRKEALIRRAARFQAIVRDARRTTAPRPTRG